MKGPEIKPRQLESNIPFCLDITCNKNIKVHMPRTHGMASTGLRYLSVQALIHGLRIGSSQSSRQQIAVSPCDDSIAGGFSRSQMIHAFYLAGQ